jgi:GT2 family glycosyltransferase
MSGTCAISVVVPTHQRRARVLAMLNAFRHQTFSPARFEVVISIDGSTDGTREALEAVMTNHALRVLCQSRRGRAAALNAGIEASSGDLTVLLDDDMEPCPTFLECHWKAHVRRPRLGVMGAVPVATDNCAPPAQRYLAAKFNGHLKNLARPSRMLLLTDFYSGNFSIRRDVLREVGGFDEDFQRYGNEDLELSFRLARSGVTFTYAPDARAAQHNDKAFAALAQDSIAEGRTAVQFALKYPEAFNQLKLGSYSRGPWLLRLLRDQLLSVSSKGSGCPNWLMRVEAAIAGIDPPGTARFYRLALGYLYWIGVRVAIDEHRNAVRQVPSLARLAQELSL